MSSSLFSVVAVCDGVVCVPVQWDGTRSLRATAQPKDQTRPNQTNHTDKIETASKFSPDDPLQTIAFVPATTRVRMQ
jgi:3,4-dihydroxy-2-butanone 4-phosphate synthase